MIVFRFELTNDRGERETVNACGHSKADMWHDLAEKVALLDRQAEVDTIKIEFVDDVSIDDQGVITMPEIVMTKGGTPRGGRPLAYVPYEKRNEKERCPKCKYSTEVKDEYRRFFGWMCTIDRDMNAEECDCYADG